MPVQGLEKTGRLVPSCPTCGLCYLGMFLTLERIVFVQCEVVEENKLLLFLAKPRHVPGRTHRGRPQLLDKLLSKDSTCVLPRTLRR